MKLILLDSIKLIIMSNDRKIHYFVIVAWYLNEIKYQYVY